MTLVKFIAALVFLYLGVVALLFIFQRSLLFHPYKEEITPAQFGLKDMEVVTVRGGELQHWFQPPSDTTLPIVMIFQGNAGHIGHRNFLAEFFLQQGYGVLLVGYRGYSTNIGSPHEKGLIEDALTAVEILKERGWADRIVLYGESLGTGLAVELAEKGIGCLMILSAGYTSLPDVAFHHYPFVPTQFLMRDKFESAKKIASVNVPTVFIHGRLDKIIPYEFGWQLFEKANEPKLWIEHETAGHNDLFNQLTRHSITDFLNQNLAKGQCRPEVVSD